MARPVDQGSPRSDHQGSSSQSPVHTRGARHLEVLWNNSLNVSVTHVPTLIQYTDRRNPRRTLSPARGSSTRVSSPRTSPGRRSSPARSSRRFSPDRSSDRSSRRSRTHQDNINPQRFANSSRQSQPWQSSPRSGRSQRRNSPDRQRPPN